MRHRDGRQCVIAGCAGAADSRSIQGHCERHVWDLSAPPMKVTCECSSPDIEWLVNFGYDAAQCRRCGSPISIHADTFGDLTPGGTP